MAIALAAIAITAIAIAVSSAPIENQDRVFNKGDQLAPNSYSQPPSGRELRNGYSLLPAPQNGRGMTVAISGEIDLSNADAFTNEVQSLFNGADGEMTLDLRNCVFIDSAGIRALVVLAQEQQARGRTLKLSGVTGEPERVLRLSGLLDSGLLDEGLTSNQ